MSGPETHSLAERILLDAEGHDFLHDLPEVRPWVGCASNGNIPLGHEAGDFGVIAQRDDWNTTRLQEVSGIHQSGIRAEYGGLP